jgi:hypothetical protein
VAWFTRIKDFLTVEAPEVRRERLARLTAIVDHHVAEWPEVGAALQEIRDSNLYRDECPTWGEFLRARWDLSESYASRLISAASLHRKTLPTGKPPRTENLARPIAALPEAVQLEAWEDAVALAGDDEVRPDHVAQVIAKRKPARRPKPTRIRVPGAIVVIEPGRGFTTVEGALEYALGQVRAKRAA